MIKNKNNIMKLLNEDTYFKDATEIDVSLKESECKNIRGYADKCLDNDFFDYKDAITMLYKDRKD